MACPPHRLNGTAASHDTSTKVQGNSGEVRAKDERVPREAHRKYPRPRD